MRRIIVVLWLPAANKLNAMHKPIKRETWMARQVPPRARFLAPKFKSELAGAIIDTGNRLFVLLSQVIGEKP